MTVTLKSVAKDIADAVREKTGGTAPIHFVDFPNSIRNIHAGLSNVNEDLPVVLWIWRDRITGEEKHIEVNVPFGGTAVPPVDAGDVQANAGKNPKLAFIGWNYDPSDLTNIRQDMIIGAEYMPSDGKTYIYLTLNEATGGNTGINATLVPGVGNATIDWGDGTTTIMSSNGTSNKTYAAPGDKVITIDAGSRTLLHNSALTGNTSGAAAVKRIFFGNGSAVQGSTFDGMQNLETVSLPRHANNTFGTRCFRDNSSLSYLVFPLGTTSVSTASQQNLYKLRFISFPVTHRGPMGNFTDTLNLERWVHPPNSEVIATPHGGVIHKVSVNDSNPSGIASFSGFNGLKRIRLPNDLTEIPTSFLNNCRNLHRRITFPAAVNRIRGSVLSNTSVEEIVFLSANPPSLAFLGLTADPFTKIFVPDASVDDYKTATNWIREAWRIFPISQLPGGL